MWAKTLFPMIVLAAAGAAGCASIAPAPVVGSGPPPEPGRELTVWLEELDARAGHRVLARNDSDRVYRLTAVTLRDCVNIREACDTHRVDIVLCPGEASRVFTVRPADPMGRSYFRWDYRARSYDPGEPVVGAHCHRPGGVR